MYGQAAPAWLTVGGQSPAARVGVPGLTPQLVGPQLGEHGGWSRPPPECLRGGWPLPLRDGLQGHEGRGAVRREEPWGERSCGGRGLRGEGP